MNERKKALHTFVTYTDESNVQTKNVLPLHDNYILSQWFKISIFLF